MIRVFFSYSHKDEAYRDELEKHLSILKRQGVIAAWHDRRIEAGSTLDTTILEQLKIADIILLLVSSDFLASDYCYAVEMTAAIERHQRGEARVVPVILRPCDWRDAPFGKLVAVPKDGKPVSKHASIDDAFFDITQEIKKIVAANPGNKSTDEQHPVAQTREQTTSLPRSSNLRIARNFSDHEKDRFLDDAFSYIRNYFEGSLQELKQRNPGIESRFKVLDAQAFSASVYYEGKLRSECMIFLGGMLGSRSINYSWQVSNSRNSLNDSLHLTEDGHMLHLKPMGMGMWIRQGSQALSQEGAAEYYWSIFMSRLQNR